MEVNAHFPIPSTSSDSLQKNMEEAENFKKVGNEKFIQGDADGAIGEYRHGISLLDDRQVRVDEDGTRLLAVLYSNLANAYLTTTCFESSWRAAWRAMELDHAALKPALRYVEARRRDGYPFEAFVYLLLRVKPLLRAEIGKQVSSKDSTVASKHSCSGMVASEAAELLAQVEATLHDELGLSRVSPQIELVEYAGGLAMISRRKFTANEVVFVEKGYTADFKDVVLNLEREVTTCMVVIRFARYLQREQQANSARWKHFKRQFCGAWPRSANDVDQEMYHALREALRCEFPMMGDAALDDLILASLMCRYNCFYAGFFRTCALANHSCRANIAMKYNSVQRTVTMIAVSDIESGEMMHVKYLTDAHFLLGVGKRRQLLRAWSFWCSCDRCMDDNSPNAIQEQVRCHHCHRFTHFPFPANDSEPDPLISDSVTCFHCHELLTYTDEWTHFVDAIVPTFPKTALMPTVPALYTWIRSLLLETTRQDLHPCHWVYRVLFYCFCVAMTSRIEELVKTLQNRNLPQKGQITELMEPFGLSEQYLPLLDAVTFEKDSKEAQTSRQAANSNTPTSVPFRVPAEGGGCEALMALEILWYLIRSIYPAYEMWAVHKAVCQLVLLHIVRQNCFMESKASTYLSTSYALLLLRRHGKYIGEKDANEWLHLYNLRHGGAIICPLNLSLSKIKQALMLK